MLFVPVVPHVPQSPPSPRTQELARLLAHAIHEYEKHNPTVSGTEIRAALDLAAQEARVLPGAGARPAVAVALGSAVLLGGVALFGLRAGGIDAGSLPMVAIAIAVIALLVGVVLVRKASDRGGGPGQSPRRPR